MQLNFGPQPLVALPFKCRCIATAANSDAVVAKSSVPADGKYEVMFPIAFPDEGTFDWLDTFLEKNPHYVELSDRKIVDWVAKSGFSKPKSTSWKNSTDKPEFNYGLVTMDDLSARKILQIVAPLVPRNYVVMEVKENLVQGDRISALKRFSNPAYKKIANVVMGEPSDAYKKIVHARILKEKKDKAETEWKAKKQERDRKKQLEARQKQLADMRKKAEDQKKKAEEDKAKKKAEEEAKKKAEEDGEDGQKMKEEDDSKEDIKKEEEKKEEDEVKKEEEEVKKEDEEDESDEPPEVELSEEEKKVWFRKSEEKDLTKQVLNQAFAKFCLPEKGEGFDEIRYEWQPAAKANTYLRTWVLERKVTSKMEDLKPSDWFKGKHENFLKTFKEWQEKQKPFAEKKDGKKFEKEDDVDDGKGDDLDLFALEDVCDVGRGVPLFVHFSFEDWALLTLRYELFLLIHAFKHDADDAERVGIHETNLVYYYNKYYHKQLTPKFYGKDTNKELVEFVKDSVIFDKDKHVLASALEADTDSLDIFVKLTEESRRERQRRVDAGDETARLKFNPMLAQVNRPTPASTGQMKGGAAPATAKPPHMDKGGWGAASAGAQAWEIGRAHV